MAYLRHQRSSRTFCSFWQTTMGGMTSVTMAPRSTRRPWTHWQPGEWNLKTTMSNPSVHRHGVSFCQAATRFVYSWQASVNLDVVKHNYRPNHWGVEIAIVCGGECGWSWNIRFVWPPMFVPLDSAGARVCVCGGGGVGVPPPLTPVFDRMNASRPSRSVWRNIASYWVHIVDPPPPPLWKILHTPLFWYSSYIIDPFSSSNITIMTFLWWNARI